MKTLIEKVRTWLYNTLYSKEAYFKASKGNYDRGFEDGKLQSETNYIEQLIRFERQLEEITSIYTSISSWLVDPEYVFSVTKTGLIYLNGKQITDRELRTYKSEIKAMKDFQIWQIVENTLRQKAIEKGMLHATNLYSLQGNEQVLGGKMMIWNWDIIKTIFNKIEKSKT